MNCIPARFTAGLGILLVQLIAVAPCALLAAAGDQLAVQTIAVFGPFHVVIALGMLYMSHAEQR